MNHCNLAFSFHQAPITAGRSMIWEAYPTTSRHGQQRDWSTCVTHPSTNQQGSTLLKFSGLTELVTTWPCATLSSMFHLPTPPPLWISSSRHCPFSFPCPLSSPPSSSPIMFYSQHHRHTVSLSKSRSVLYNICWQPHSNTHSGQNNVYVQVITIFILVLKPHRKQTMGSINAVF